MYIKPLVLSNNIYGYTNSKFIVLIIFFSGYFFGLTALRSTSYGLHQPAMAFYFYEKLKRLMPISKRYNFVKYAIGILRAWFFAKQKPSGSEPGVARAKGIAQNIFQYKIKTHNLDINEFEKF